MGGALFYLVPTKGSTCHFKKKLFVCKIGDEELVLGKLAILDILHIGKFVLSHTSKIHRTV